MDSLRQTSKCWVYLCRFTSTDAETGDPIFPDTIMSVGTIDRLIRHASTLKMQGECYREVERF